MKIWELLKVEKLSKPLYHVDTRLEWICMPDLNRQISPRGACKWILICYDREK